MTSGAYETGIKGVQPDELDAAWPLAVPFISDVIERFGDEWTLDAVLEGLQGNELQLWLGYTDGALDGAGVTRIADYPTCRVCIVLFLAGNMDTLAHMEQIERWALDTGCNRVWAYCRRGVGRYLKDVFGFREMAVVMEKRLCRRTH